MQSPERNIDTLSVRRPQPHTTNLQRKRREREIVEDKKGESNQAIKKTLDLLLKPANPTPSNTGSTRAFQRDTERGIKQRCIGCQNFEIRGCGCICRYQRMEIRGCECRCEYPCKKIRGCECGCEYLEYYKYHELLINMICISAFFCCYRIQITEY